MARCETFEHEWPFELGSSVKCERCGLEYGQWTQEVEEGVRFRRRS